MQEIGLTRRHFMGITAGGVLGGMFNTSFSHAAVPGKEIPMRIGIIGCGHQGLRHLKQLHQHLPKHNIEYEISMCDSDAYHLANASNRYQGSTFSNWEQLLDTTAPHGVIIATPDSLHAPIAIAALNQGTAVFCEPPLAMTLPEAREVYDLAQQYGRPLYMAIDQAWSDEINLARQEVSNGKLGRLRWIQGASGASLRGYSHADNTQAIPWWHSPEHSLGSAARAHFEGLYPLIVATDLGMPLRASTAADCFITGNPDLPDTLLTTLDYPNGVTLVMTSSPGNVDRRAPVLRGDHGDLEILPATNNTTGSALSQWIHAIQIGADTKHDTSRWAFETQVALNLALASAKSGNTVTLESILNS